MKKIIYLLVAKLMMVCAVECSAQTVTGNKDGHDYVDLGLPSGRLWATYNVGSNKPTENGEYFAWGETTPKKDYTWATYKWCKGSKNSMTKYCIDSKYGKVDSLSTLLAEDDAATANWGAGWRMPTTTELQELIEGCDWKWTKNFKGSGVVGRIGTSKSNGKIIFMPAAGSRYDTDLSLAGYYGYYWSSSLYEDGSSDAYYLDFGSDGIYWNSDDRYYGQSVRAVVK